MKRCAPTLGVAMLTLVVGAMFLGSAPDADAQPARVERAARDDLRAAYANAAEIAEGKRVADASCAGCHGADGISTTKDVPHLAGQRPAYLYLELRAYQSGARGNNAMGAAVKFLNDDALVKVAAYYASLDPALPSVPGSAKPPQPSQTRFRPARLRRRPAPGATAKPASARPRACRAWSEWTPSIWSRR